MDKCVNYVSQSISQVRWRPTVSSLEKSKLFATGSSEDIDNTVCLWDTSHMMRSPLQNDGDDLDIENFEQNPKKISTVNVGAGVAALSYVKMDGIVAGTTSGQVKYFNVDATQKLSETYSWPRLHCKRGGCSGIDGNLPDIATVGDDGNIHIIHVGYKTPLHSIVAGDSCAITAVRWLSTNEICTCNSIGQLRMWDVRAPSTSPAVRVMVSSETPFALTSLDHHPSQPHMVVVGGADGCVTFFDIREEKAAVAKLQLHEHDVCEVRFNQQSPDLMYTCSGDGSVRKLDTSSNIRLLACNEEGSGGSPIQISEVISDCPSFNSIDVSGNSILCSNDSEAIYLINDEPTM